MCRKQKCSRCSGGANVEVSPPFFGKNGGCGYIVKRALVPRKLGTPLPLGKRECCNQACCPWQVDHSPPEASLWGLISGMPCTPPLLGVCPGGEIEATQKSWNQVGVHFQPFSCRIRILRGNPISKLNPRIQQAQANPTSAHMNYPSHKGTSLKHLKES